MNAFQFGQMVKAALGPEHAGMAENVPAGYLEKEPQFNHLPGGVANSLAFTPAGADRLTAHRPNGIGGNNNSFILVNPRNNHAYIGADGYSAAKDTYNPPKSLQYGDSRSFAPGAPRGTGSAARAAAPQLPKPAAPAPSAPANQSIFSALPKR